MHNSLLTVDIACDDHLLHLLNEMCTSRCNSGGSPSIRRKFTLTPVSCLGAHLFSVARGKKAKYQADTSLWIKIKVSPTAQSPHLGSERDKRPTVMVTSIKKGYCDA
jgi:hypothetical protein